MGKRRMPYAVGIIAIVALVMTTFVAVSAMVLLNGANDKLESRIDNMEKTINALTDDEISDMAVRFEEIDNEIGNLKENYDVFVNNLTVILSVFALLVTICTVLMPLYTYNFLQKDQIEQFHRTTAHELDLLKNTVSTTVKELKCQQHDMKSEIDARINSIKNTEDSFTKWLDELFKPIDFEDIKIEPIANIGKDDIDYYYRKAYVNLSIGKADKAIKILNAILMSEPRCEKALLAKAQALYSVNKYNEAVEILNTLIELFGNTEYYYIRGCVKFKAGDYSASINDFRFVYEKEPENEDNIVKLAAALHKNRQTNEAIKFQTMAIKLNNNAAQYYADRGIMNHALKNYPEALADKRQAITLSPNNGQYYGIYSATLFKLHDYEKTVEFADKAIATDEKMAFVYSFRGLAKAHLSGKYSNSEAKSDLDTAIKLDKDNHRNYRRRAEFNIMVNNIDKAIGDLNMAAKIDPMDPETMFLYSEAYRKKGDDKKSNEFIIKAKQMGYIPEYGL